MSWLCRRLLYQPTHADHLAGGIHLIKMIEHHLHRTSLHCKFAEHLQSRLGFYSRNRDSTRRVGSQFGWHVRAPLSWGFRSCLTACAPRFVSRMASFPSHRRWGPAARTGLGVTVRSLSPAELGLLAAQPPLRAGDGHALPSPSAGKIGFNSAIMLSRGCHENTMPVSPF